MRWNRFKILKVGYCLFVSLIVLRLAYWQVYKNDDLSARAENQRIFKVEVTSPRGQILYSDGSVLVSNQPSYLIFAQPKVISDKAMVAKRLAEVLAEYRYGSDWNKAQGTITEAKDLIALNDQRKVQTKEIEDQLFRLLNKDLYWVSLGYNVPFTVKESIIKLNLSGIGFDQKTVRFYPESSSSAHLLGFVSSDSYGVDKGYFGVEGYYNGEIKGKKGFLTQEKDAHGRPILIGQYTSALPPEGKTLMLNVDRTVQNIVETKLKRDMLKFGARGASAIVLDPKTGGVLAMASYPNYDPGAVFDFPKESFRNPVTVDSYEPGSTFKVLVMAAAINEGLVKPDTVCDICAGPLEIGGFTIRTWNNQYNPGITMTDVIIHSDNTGMVYVSRKLGLEKLYDYIQKFGFGQLSGIDVEDEYAPPLRPKINWHEIDVATASFGQGVSVNEMQVVRAVAAIANGGKLMEPHVAQSIKNGDQATAIIPRQVGQPITPESATIVKEMMVKAVEEGEAKFFRVKGFRVAGKTGTAQIPVAGHYDANKTIASFVGFAPADNPKFVMLVRYDEPSASIYGAETAAPTFFDIARDLFLYYGILPDE